MIQVYAYLLFGGLILLLLAAVVGTLWLWWKAWRARCLNVVVQNLARAARARRLDLQSVPEDDLWPCSFTDPAGQIPPPMFGGGRITLNLSDHLNPIGIEQQAQWDARRSGH